MVDHGDHPGKLRSIQMLRALAAFAVFLAHIPFVGWGAFGVDLFFVISGFMMCHVAPRERRYFFLYRLFRIIPLYWIATLGLWLGARYFPLLLGINGADTASLLKSLFFIPYGHGTDGAALPILGLGWSLNYEMLFYAVFALCQLAFGSRWAAVACAIALLLATAVGQTTDLPMPWRFWATPYLVEFVAGIGAYYSFILFGARMRKLPLWVWAAIAGSGMAFSIITSITIPHLRTPGVIIPCAFLIFLSTLLTEGKWRVPALAVLIGDASYSFYLLHPYVIAVLRKTLNPMTQMSWGSLFAAAAAAAGAVILARISFRLIERPSNRALRALLPIRKRSDLFDSPSQGVQP